MIVTCPDCQTRYLVDPVALGERGRLVRCGKCSHTWAQTPTEEDLAARVERPPPPPPEPEPIAEPEPEPDLGEQLFRPRPPPPGGRRSNLPALRKRRSPWPARAAWATVIVLVAIIVGGAATMRSEIEAVWPAAARIYAQLGAEQRPLGYGLDLRNVKSGEARENGVNILLVQGQIANTTQEVRNVPTLRGSLLDRRNRELQRWTFSAPENRLLPGETVDFHTRLTNPVAGAVRLTIVFVRKQ